MIPKEIATAAAGLLAPYCEGLTADKLQSALAFLADDEEIEERLLTRREAAKALRVSVPTVDRCLRDGTLPKRLIRGSVRIPQSAVARILAGGEVSR